MIRKKQLVEFEKHHIFVIVFLLIGFVFILNIFAFSQLHENISSGAKDIGFPIVVASRQDVAMENESTTVNNLTPLKSDIQGFINGQSVPMSAAVIDLNSGNYIGINDETTYQAASLYKLYAGYELLLRVDEEAISLDQEAGYDAGETTLDECFKLMISESDNDCGRAIRKVVNADAQPLPRLAELGFVGTSLINDYPTSSARDTALLFSKLYNQEDLSEASNQMFIDALAAQTINDRIPKGLPNDVSVAHKTADLEGYSHDGGIIYAPFGDYVLVILTGPWDNGYDDAPVAHIELTELVYDWLESNS